MIDTFLSDGVARVLALNLSGLLQTQNVRTFPWHAQRRPELAVKVSVPAAKYFNRQRSAASRLDRIDSQVARLKQGAIN